MLDPIAVIGVIGTIITTVVGAGVKGIWVWGWVYKNKEKDLTDMTKDRNFWRDVALKGLGHTAKALDLAAKGTNGE